MRPQSGPPERPASKPGKPREPRRPLMLGYCRVSTDEQARNGHGREAQRAALRDAAIVAAGNCGS